MKLKRKGTRGCPAKVAGHRNQPERLCYLSVNKDVFSRWRKIGKDEGFETDTEIARFFIKQYNDNSRGIFSVPCCIHCNKRLTLFCSRCFQGDDQTRAQRVKPKPQQALKTVPVISNQLKSTLQNVFVCIKPLNLKLYPSLLKSLCEGKRGDGSEQSTTRQENESTDDIYSEASSAVTGAEHLQHEDNTDSDVMASSGILAEHNYCVVHDESDFEPLSSPSGSVQDSVNGVCQNGLQELISASDNSLTDRLGPGMGASALDRGNKTAQEPASVSHPNDFLHQDLLSEPQDNNSRNNRADLVSGTRMKEADSVPKTETNKKKAKRKQKLDYRYFIDSDSDCAVEDPDGTLLGCKKEKSVPFSVVCKVCLKVFGKHTELKHHMRVHTVEKPFKCEKCDLCFSSEYRLNSHFSKHHSENLTCQECGLKLRTQKSLKKHVRRQHVGKTAVICDKCGKPFSSIWAMRKHILKKHTAHEAEKHTGGEAEVFVCEVCGSSYCTKTKMKQHLRSHSTERPFSCQFCSATFKHKGNLRAHTAMHTGNLQHVCKHCGKAFFQLAHLDRHLKIHSGIKPYACQLCSAAFLFKEKLTAHTRRVHLGYKPYKCSLCPCSFVHSYELVTHSRVHTGEKPFKCDICGAAFGRSGHLKIHKEIHTGDTPYSCSECGSQFRYKVGLTMHMKRHTDNGAVSAPEGTGGAMVTQSAVPPPVSLPDSVSLGSDTITSILTENQPITQCPSQLSSVSYVVCPSFSVETEIATNSIG